MAIYYKVAETCEIALERVLWLHGKDRESENLVPSPYTSVDPAPPTSCETDTGALRTTLLNEDATLFTRYRAMFALRNRNDEDAVLALADGNYNQVICEKCRVDFS